MTADETIRIVFTSVEWYTLPTRFNTSAGNNPRIITQKYVGVQMIKQNLSLAYFSIGSFPRSPDMNTSTHSLPAAECYMNGWDHSVQKYQAYCALL
jgi:hypothetical protein